MVKAIIKELNQLSASGVCVAAWHDKQYLENAVLFLTGFLINHLLACTYVDLRYLFKQPIMNKIIRVLY